MTALVIADLTESSLDGKGVFDVLMRANKAHLESEFQKNRIKGSEYSTVYLGSLEAAMRISLEFLTQRQRIDLEARLMEQQILVAQAQVTKSLSEVDLMKAQVLKAVAEVDLMKEQVAIAKVQLEINRLGLEKIPAEIAHLNAQTGLIGQQKLNAEVEKDVLLNTVCKLKAEYDVLLGTVQKVAAENALLTQKSVTEKAQVTAIGVDDNSVIGKQKILYAAQTDGFARDAEQKAAKLMADVWSVQRTTDSGVKPTDGLGGNNLTDAYIGKVISKMVAGVKA